MTKYLASKLEKRELGSGCETHAYEKWGNKNLATLFTQNKYKWHWLNFLGLVRSPQVKVTVEYGLSEWRNVIRRDRLWRFDVLKLRPVLPNDPRFKEIWPEMRRFENARNVLDLSPSNFKVLRPVVEFCLKTQTESAGCDGNYFNFLEHPRKHIIYPYDYFVPPSDLRIDLL